MIVAIMASIKAEVSPKMIGRTPRTEWAEVFSALASSQRLQIIERLMKGPVRCQEFLNDLGLSQPAISYHLGKLERAGILRKEKDGTRNCYRINPDLREIIRECMKEDGSWITL
jgi:DNA-binding transcriptional ArsR family regulator